RVRRAGRGRVDMQEAHTPDVEADDDGQDLGARAWPGDHDDRGRDVEDRPEHLEDAIAGGPAGAEESRQRERGVDEAEDREQCKRGADGYPGPDQEDEAQDERDAAAPEGVAAGE